MEESELLVEFVEEAREHLGDIEIQLLQIEAMGEAVDDDLVNTVFRAIHSIKGAAGFLGLQQVNEVSHRLENILGLIREKKLVPDPYNVDVMLKAADRLNNMVESVETSNETDNTEICKRLDAILNPAVVGAAGEATADVTADAPASAGSQSSPEPEAASEPDAAPAAEDAKEIQGSAAQPAVPAPKQPSQPAAAAVATRLEKSIDSIESNVQKATAPESPPSKAGPKPPASDPTIRVGVRVLDRLMNLAGELVLSRNQLVQAMSTEPSAPSNSQAAIDRSGMIDTVVSGIDQVTTDLQEAIMQTRMQPIGNVFNKFPRVIRDLSSTLGKQILLKTEGNEVETDKTIIEAIADPLTHLIRNSCDHGVETPAVRTEAGKPAEGTVVLKAYHQAGKVMIEIIDDGAGIDPAKLKAKAIDKGILDEESAESMSDRDAVNLIFAPGFSTAAQITDVSGRGVGMDVVRTNIEKIGGSVEVHSTFGKGSTVSITLPLTLAIVPSMIVGVGDLRYALPQSNIVELVRTDGKEKCIQRANSTEVLRLRGSLLPLVRLRKVLGMSESADSKDASRDETEGEPSNDDSQLVVIETGRLRFALAVDRVLDSEEIVVKPLGRHLSNLPLLAGSTILGDGRVAMILDATGIASRIDMSNEATDKKSDSNNNLDENADFQRMVLLSLNAQDRFAVSMDIISRIERVPVTDVELVGDQRILQYRGTTLPLLSIDDTIQTGEVDASEHIHVLVFKVYGHEVGLIAPYLHDIRDCDLSGGVQASHEEGVAGIAVVDSHSIRLLDLYGLTEVARPDWFVKPQDTEDADTPASILVCEDSAFFRTFLTKTLAEEGHKVVDAEDGEEGWTILNERPNDFDLLLTDVEMPNLDGLGLTKRARADGRFDDLPIIALTSLADEDSTARGRAAGVSDYQVKMNKPELLGSILRLTRAAKSNKGA